jgi:phage shock protein E
MSGNAKLIPLALLCVAACAAEPVGPIAPQELAERIAAGEAPAILDVRSAAEYRAGHLPGAIHVPHDELGERLAELPFARTDEVAVHCQSGRRAALAREVLTDAGFTRVRDLEGHWAAWQAADLPVE